ncbi:hypothetical protein MJO28_010188 [Puccinia striiformis f. sp. tritici]|uniref:RRM domain-containing protein n=2 Tax=Puccinia striiformis f. sp. tritici TaxID=168172 RepID=A0A0L0VT62_9BASI|nr:hypothetical protein MJO28_010188 [Puccinia striiformis f. sp. tritici]KAI7948264.1 hypothetical protein MJO29_009929 [Puccinia striiformis f. sp. tritici]KNF02407.1 hypothetical protein PSTG_04314 [Puccinia striiformis f. sp. tritici PST-78]
MSTAMNLDRPLDEIISDKRKQHKRSGGIARRGGRTNGTGPVRNGRPPRAQPTVVPVPTAKSLQLPPQMGPGSKIIVSNLPSDVTENQIRELFSTTVGPVTKVTLSYDNRGTSKGTAQVEFRKNEDSTKAFQQYNKRLIDQTCPNRSPLGPLPRSFRGLASTNLSRVVGSRTLHLAILSARNNSMDRAGSRKLWFHEAIASS